MQRISEERKAAGIRLLIANMRDNALELERKSSLRSEAKKQAEEK